MNATEIRDENFRQLQAQWSEHRRAVYEALAQYGPLTTRQLAERMGAGWNELNVRPRVTELKQECFVVLSGRAGREGVYGVATLAEMEAHAAALRGDVASRQQMLC